MRRLQSFIVATLTYGFAALLLVCMGLTMAGLSGCSTANPCNDGNDTEMVWRRPALIRRVPRVEPVEFGIVEQAPARTVRRVTRLRASCEPEPVQAATPAPRLAATYPWVAAPAPRSASPCDR